MTKNITPANDLVGRLDVGAMSAIEEFVKDLFADKCRSSGAMQAEKAKIDITIRLSNEHLGTKTIEVSIPNPILYASSGCLTGSVNGHDICVNADGKEHFRASVDGKLHHPFSQSFVEEELKIKVQEKHWGGNSEPIPRAVWRHLVDSYNLFDSEVAYDRQYDKALFKRP